eukprot:2998390-Pleurochrysis_carterae.AAC.2
MFARVCESKRKEQKNERTGWGGGAAEGREREREGERVGRKGMTDRERALETERRRVKKRAREKEERRMCVCVCARVCVRVCVRERARGSAREACTACVTAPACSSGRCKRDTSRPNVSNSMRERRPPAPSLTRHAHVELQAERTTCANRLEAYAGMRTQS